MIHNSGILLEMMPDIIGVCMLLQDYHESKVLFDDVVLSSGLVMVLLLLIAVTSGYYDCDSKTLLSANFVISWTQEDCSTNHAPANNKYHKKYFLTTNDHI